MGLFDTLKSALGLQRPIRPVAVGDLELSPAARNQLARLRPDEGLLIDAVPSGDEFTLRVRVVALTELPEGLRIFVQDAERMRGLTVDWDGDRFKPVVELALRGVPTPNPDGRLFVTSRLWVDGDPQFYRPEDETQPPLPARILSVPGVVSVLFREHTLTVQREGDASWSTIDTDVEAQLREYLLHCGQALAARERRSAGDDLLQEARDMLARDVAPAVHADGGDIELIDIVDGIARVRMVGACDGCPASELTLRGGIQKALTASFPGLILGVEAV